MEKGFIFSFLPNDLVNKIIEYTGKLTFRFGKYMNKIEDSDKRYKILEKIKKPLMVAKYIYNIYLIDDSQSGYILQYCIRNTSLNFDHLFVNFIKNGYHTSYDVYKFTNNWNIVIDNTK